MKISFVIAVYRNEGSLKKTYDEIKFIFNKYLNKYIYEVIFVDDGSDDGSLKELLKLKKVNKNVKVLSFTRNFGQMAAILAGLKEASGDAVINISADLQDPLEMVPKMVKSWEDGSEIVACCRVGRSDSYSAKFFSNLAYRALKLSFPQLPTGGFDYVLIDRKPLNEYNSIDVRNRSFQGDLLWMGYKTSFIPYFRLKRSIGKSQYNFSKKLKNFLDAFLDSSYIPIRIISVLGISTSIIGVLYGLTVIYAWFNGETPFSGWAPIMLAILFVGGFIMIMLGIIGEYIWRIYSELRKKPNYVIRKKYL